MKSYSIQELQSFVAQIYGGRQTLIVPYAYNVTFLSLAQGATQTQQLSITANADFVLTGLAHRALVSSTQTVSNKTAPMVRLLITDSGSNEQFSNTGIDLENYSNNGEGSRLLPYPRFIQGRTALTLQATHYGPTAETYSTLDVMLAGVLVRALS
jgi:hypothetical protein